MAAQTVLDQAGAVQDTQSGEPGESTPAEGQKEENFLGTWKTKEAAEKGFEDFQKIQSKLQSERDKALAENTKLQQTVLSKLTDAVTQKPGQPVKTKAELDAEFAAMAEELENGGGKATLEAIAYYTQDTQARMQAEFEAKLKAQQEQYEARFGSIGIELQKRDPDYIARKEIVDTLKEKQGLSHEQATAVAKMIKPEVQQPPQPPLAGTSATVRAGVSEPDATLGDDQVRALESISILGKMTAAEKKALANRRKK